MPVELVFARQERPVGLSTLEQVRALKDEAQEAANTAATAAVEAAGPAIAEAIQGAAEAAAPAAAAAAAPAAADAIRAEVAADANRAEAAAGTAATEAATLAAQQAAEQVAPIAAAAVRAEVQADVQTAQTAAGTATSEADRAVAARDAASLIAQSKGAARAATIAAAITVGRGMVADGEAFTAAADDVDYIGIYRRDNDSTQMEIARLPTASALSFIEYFDEDYSELVYAIVSANDKVLIGQTHAGLTIQSTPERAADSFETFDNEYSTLAFALVTDDGRVPSGVRKDGFVIGSTQSAETLLAPTVRRPRVFETALADINHHAMNGQSLSVRSATYLPLKSALNVALSGGLILRRTATGNTFVPMNSFASESGVLYNAMQQYRFLVDGDETYSGDPDHQAARTILASSHGTSGSAIEKLVKGGSDGSYEDLIFAVSEAQRIASASGQITAVQSLSWFQGEANRLDTAAQYKAKFLAMLTDYRADIFAANNQPLDFPVFVYQPSGQQYLDTAGAMVPNAIAQAYWEASNEDPRIIIYAPTYMIPHADELHPTPGGGLTMGMQLGKAMYKRCHRGENWRPLEPRRVSQHSARVLSCAFNVPDGPLIFDTDSVTDPGDYGFVIGDNSGSASISSIEIIEDTVKIVAARNLGAGAYLSYAHFGIGGNGGGPTTGARGCLRDSDPTIGANGATNLWNWGVSFKAAINFVKGQ